MSQCNVDGLGLGFVVCRQHEAELRQSREECWAYQQELTALREKLATLKTTLEDRRRDVVSYKVNQAGTAAILHCLSRLLTA